ncbi:MAG: thioredoxin [Cyanobacteriota bacterium]|nr:thioredoxin [Cyanobacteriota bacterium]
MAHKQQFKSFADMIEHSETPVLVDFYASWCGPCRLMAGVLDQVKAEVGERVAIVKVDTEKYPQIAMQWQINALPTLILFKNGQPIDRIEGVLQPKVLVDRLQQQVA